MRVITGVIGSAATGRPCAAPATPSRRSAGKCSPRPRPTGRGSTPRQPHLVGRDRARGDPPIGPSPDGHETRTTTQGAIQRRRIDVGISQAYPEVEPVTGEADRIAARHQVTGTHRDRGEIRVARSTPVRVAHGDRERPADRAGESDRTRPRGAHDRAGSRVVLPTTISRAVGGARRPVAVHHRRVDRWPVRRGLSDLTDRAVFGPATTGRDRLEDRGCRSRRDPSGDRGRRRWVGRRRERRGRHAPGEQCRQRRNGADTAVGGTGQAGSRTAAVIFDRSWSTALVWI